MVHLDPTRRPDFWTMEPVYDDHGNVKALRHSVKVDKSQYHIEFTNETEHEVTIVLQPKEAPNVRN